MRKEKEIAAAPLVIAIVILVVAVVVGAAAYYVTRPAAEPEAPAIKIASGFNGPITDGGWNTIGYQGLVAVEENLDVEFEYSEFVGMADAERVAREYIDSGINTILFHGGEFTTTALSMAEEFPEINFILVAAKMEDIPPNLWILDQLSYNVTYYLCGRIAGMITETDTIGWVGGMDLPHGLVGVEQFERGILEENPDATLLSPIWLGDFNDPVKTRDATTALIGEGADVVYSWTDLGFYGSVEAAKEAVGKVYLMAVNVDRGHIDPDRIVTTSVTDFRIGYIEIVMQIIEGNRGGIYGLPFPTGTYLAPLRGGVSAEVKARVEEIIEDILAGNISIPSLYLAE